MRAYNWIRILIIIIMILFVTGIREQKTKTLNETQEQLSTIQNATETVMKDFQYKNPYQENFTINDFITNTIHIIIYPIFKEFHTAIGIITNYVWKKITYNTIIKTIKITLTILTIWLILKAIKPIGIIYVIIQNYYEKKHKKQANPWLTILLATIILIIIIGGIIGITLLMF